MQRRLAKIFLLFLPGLALAAITLAWGFRLSPPSYEIPQWNGRWSEPKQPPDRYKSWREEDGTIIGETEPWPHKHPRANSYLLSADTFEGDVRVELTVRFLRGRYFGCYLCYDPDSDSGYWLSTGHAVGDFADHAYVKIVQNGDWETKARAPLAIEPEKEYRIAYVKSGDELSVEVDGEPVVTWENGQFQSGRVQLRLHNTKAAISGIRVSEFGIWNSGFGIRSSGFGVRDSGFGVRKLGFGVRIPKP